MLYLAPKSIDQAVGALLDHPGARVFAGATDVMPQLRAGRREPSAVIDLKGIPALMALSEHEAHWSIGAALPTALLTANTALRRDFPGLTEAAALIGSDQVQSRSSLGGNLANASPAADSVPALIANDAYVVIASSSSTRQMPVADVVVGPGRTALDDDEIIVEFIIAKPAGRVGDAYLRLTPRTEMDIAVAGAAARIALDDDGTVREAKVVLGALAPTARRVQLAEELLVGETLVSPSSGVDHGFSDNANTELWRSVTDAVREACDPIDDKRGTAEYRRHVAGVLTIRALRIATERAANSQTRKDGDQ